MKHKRLVDSLLLAVLAALLIAPLFRIEYLDNWPSIESTFIADARMLANHLPRPGWQPNWYCGTRFDYIYPPALRYGTVLIAKLGSVSTARAYHLYIAIFYVFGIVAVYWLTLAGSRSRLTALLSAAAAALLSPSFPFLTAIRHDSPDWVPQRLHVLMLYGEGPHITALAILPAALAAAWIALRERRPAMLALAAALCALMVANNFYGATALAIFFLPLTWSVWTTERTWRVPLRAAFIALLACGLSAFWLTPSYLRITLTDLKWVADPGNNWSLVLLLAVLAIYAAVSFRFANRRPDRAWIVFVSGAALILGLDVIGYVAFGFSVAGNSARLVPELDLALILAGAEYARRAWQRPTWRVPVALAVALAFAPAVVYLQHSRSPFPKAQPLAQTYDYQIANWIHEHIPGERVLPTGTVRFWFDAWADNVQTDGGSLQGMLNQNIPAAAWQIIHDPRATISILWMQALGTDAVIVPDTKSREPYHDYLAPEKFRHALPALFDDGQGTVVYRIPRVYPGIGRVVQRAPLSQVGKLRGGDDTENLTPYVAAVENPAQPAAPVTWKGYDELTATTTAGTGDSLLLQETWDPAWHAWEQGRELPIRQEPVLSFMLIDLPPGPHTVQLRFETPAEDKIGLALLALSLAVIGALIALEFRRDKSIGS